MRVSCGSVKNWPNGIPLEKRGWPIETVHQNLLLCDNLDIAANVVLGEEPTRFRFGPLKIMDHRPVEKKRASNWIDWAPP